MILRDKKRLGGGIFYTKAWLDYFCNDDFVEVGTYPANHPFAPPNAGPGKAEGNPAASWWYAFETGPVDFRLRFTPTEPCTALLRSSLRVRVGDGSGHKRLFGKCQIVRVLPTPKILMHYEEGGLELIDETAWGPTQPLLRHYDPNFNPYCFDEIEEAEGLLGQEHVYAVKMFGVDYRQVQAVYGAPFTLIA